jgi:hypothetical protein
MLMNANVCYFVRSNTVGAMHSHFGLSFLGSTLKSQRAIEERLKPLGGGSSCFAICAIRFVGLAQWHVLFQTRRGVFQTLPLNQGQQQLFCACMCRSYTHHTLQGHRHTQTRTHRHSFSTWIAWLPACSLKAERVTVRRKSYDLFRLCCGTCGVRGASSQSRGIGICICEYLHRRAGARIPWGSSLLVEAY